MPELPIGTVTFLFTDIQGSTRLVEELGAGFRAVLEAHQAILRRAIGAHRGIEVSTEGDAFFAVFPAALDAVQAAVQGQRELAAGEWPPGVAVLVRMGLHTGDAELGGDNYVGVDVHRAARIAAAGHGGQVLISETTRTLVQPSLPSDVVLRDLGLHRLKDLSTLERLHQVVIAGLPADFPPLRSLDSSRTNLVAPSTPFIGRDGLLAEASRLLTGARLLTLVGPGGTGKTRLAIELGRQALAQFEDGAFLVPLETIRERSMVASAVAQAVGARIPGQREPEDALIDHLADRDLLLILDNFEQVIEAAAPFAARLLTAAARLRMVVTSRIPLHVSGEQEFPVPPLAVPDGEMGLGLEALARVEAIALFVECARRVQPAFQLTDSNATAVVAICRRLDGLPLAIELAAARVKVLSPDAMLNRLESALALLAGGRIDLPERQRTLRAAIEWSYRLLTEAEQALFRRLTVFRGGWTVDAAEQVAAPGEGMGLDVLDGLSALVDQSLVRPAPDRSADEPRFEMLQLIREYGAEQLAETTEAVAVARRHADWMLALVEAGAPALEAGTDLGWLDRLTRENDNLRAALGWSVDQGERELGLRLASAAWRFWQQRGHIREGRQWFERLLPVDVAAGPIDARVLAAAHTAAGGLAYWQSIKDDAERHYLTALELDRNAGFADRVGDDVYNLAFVDLVRGDVEAARQRLAESADLFVAAGQPARLADTTAARGAVEMRAGNLEEARDWMIEGRRLHLQNGNRPRVIDNAMVLSTVNYRLGDTTAAREWLLMAAVDIREMGDVARWPLALDVGVALALKAGRPEDALRLGAASARRRAEAGAGRQAFVLDAEQLLAEARSAVQQEGGQRAVDEAWAEGEGLDDDALVAIIGSIEDPPTSLA